ncbi:hypothetical protein HOD30_05280 [Candidatus Peregrinibacteria bacterium]|jgi:hypothetical protein|nr:hypothetical protein [Candidatus Peregrinibacteria bacterium]MBT4631433.1 hypothetical protein [Candidatus Peregrinibacteria bacterium]MBT5516918.1 hypothetical protein [Candidatus Peregrinibacteria bacterium]MBT5823822.1 hypothetical protein [Candidatus Peregrinibacteria bacterium]
MKSKACVRCSSDFHLTDKDEWFYNENKIPEPTRCPNCRALRRYTWRNERVLYVRKCNGTGKTIMATFDENVPFPVYDVPYWFSDAWDGRDYGRDFDFNRPFFEQFRELQNVVPQLARSVSGNENCDFTNQAGWNKNCYLIFEANYSEDCYYSSYIQYAKDSVDCLRVRESQLCYESINMERCYNIKFSEDCTSCSDSWFLKSCIGSRNCFGSVNLRNKEFYFFNEQCTPEQYERRLSEVGFGSENIEAGIKQEDIQKMREQFYAFQLKFPHKYMVDRQTENSTGSYILNSQNCEECFGIWNCQDCKFVVDSNNMKNVYDVTVFGADEGAEFCCDSHEIGAGCRNVYYSHQILGGHSIYYSSTCFFNNTNIFGCSSLKRANYCILNKQYTKEEYEELVPKIIEHMKKTGEWGEFFPMSLSPWDYNETLAQEYFPLSKEQVQAMGLKWKDQKQLIPQEGAIICEVSGKPFKIIQQEAEFYKRFGLPTPLRHPDQRYTDRMARTLPRHLWERPCDKCATQLQSPYSPERPEIIYCDSCYLGEVY